MPGLLADASELENLTVPAATVRRHELPRGAEVQPDGCVRFRFWAPAAKCVRLEIDGLERVLLMHASGDGWHELTTREAQVGSRYFFVLPDGTRVNDPASRFQPEDVQGPGEVIDPASYLWDDAGWENRPWHEAVLYELHVGAFTQEGTFRGAIAKLDHLAALGVTGIEIMPVADFPGRRNWGYDGVLMYAPDSTYGRPEDLKALVEAAHARGLMVILDVVYNHFGPEGNYLTVYAPDTLTERHKTPWGSAVNYDGEGSDQVREFAIQNAIYWLEEFNLDGLRLDAVHQIKDDGPKHLLAEMEERIRAAVARPVHLILENDNNESSRLLRSLANEARRYTAQWNDDMHHVLHTAATLETMGYYSDYTRDPEKLGRALAEGFAFQGEVSSCTGDERGEPSALLPPSAFVTFMQNHDQIGNRAFGERINAIASPEAVHAVAAIYLLMPQIPMLFMGEEWGSSQPFPFFCDFTCDLADKIRKGRREEFAKLPEFKDPAKRERIPDPLAEETFLSGKLDWEQSAQGVHGEWMEWYKRILRVRREVIVPVIPEIGGCSGSYQVVGDGAVAVSWKIADDGELILLANLCESSTDGFPAVDGEVLWQEGPEAVGSLMRPWSVRWALTGSLTT